MRKCIENITLIKEYLVNHNVWKSSKKVNFRNIWIFAPKQSKLQWQIQIWFFGAKIQIRNFDNFSVKKCSLTLLECLWDIFATFAITVMLRPCFAANYKPINKLFLERPNGMFSYSHWIQNRSHSGWKSPKMSHLNFDNFHQFLSY